MSVRALLLYALVLAWGLGLPLAQEPAPAAATASPERELADWLYLVRAEASHLERGRAPGPDPSSIEFVRERLRCMVSADEHLRAKLSELVQQASWPAPVRAAGLRWFLGRAGEAPGALASAEGAHANALRTLLDSHPALQEQGWPTLETAGAQACFDAWSLAQHAAGSARPWIQTEWVPRLRVLAESDAVPARLASWLEQPARADYEAFAAELVEAGEPWASFAPALEARARLYVQARRQLRLARTAIEARAACLDDDYHAFDQTPGRGWRAIAERGWYHEAGELLDRYRAEHPGLDAGQLRILHFHAGQMYAHAYAYERARPRFLDSLMEEEPPDAPLLWNDYVLATLAFLDGDRELLLLQRETLAAGPRIDGLAPNLAVVERLLAHLGEPYAVAYSGRGR